MTELEELQRAINLDLSRINKVNDQCAGFTTVKVERTLINKNTSRFDVVTMGRKGNIYRWSYERTLPHKITTKNVDSIRNQLDKASNR